MKHLAIILFSLLCATYSASAQKVIIGDKIPTIKSNAWLMDAEPDSAPYTCIVFYHSESELCIKSLENIKGFCGEYNGLFNLVVITKEDYAEAGVTLTSFLDNHSGVLFDNNGKIFNDFGVKFVPFSVIYNAKHKIVWCGNSASLTLEIFRNIVTEKDKI